MMTTAGRVVASGLLLFVAACAPRPDMAQSGVPLVAPRSPLVGALPARVPTISSPSQERLGAIGNPDREAGIPDEQVGRWHLRCLRNRTRAEVECFAVNQVSLNQVRVEYVKEISGRIIGPLLDMSPTNNCPGYARTIRVDENAPVRIHYPARASNAGAEAAAVRQMEQGAVLRAEGFRWPYCVGRDEAHEIGGFREAHARLRSMIREARP